MKDSLQNKLGLHFKLQDKLTALINKAISFQVPFFQTFFTMPNGKYIIFENSDLRNFLDIRREKFKNIYLHASYYINLCSSYGNGYRIFEKELNMAKKAEFTHIILHPGAATGFKNKLEGIDILAKSLNKILKKENNISIVLENIAHGNLSIGGDIFDYTILLSKLDKPDLISFCIDTAHAYSYGYDLSNANEQENFINLIKNQLGIEKIALIHLNDTSEVLGLKIDKHNIPGQGNIGKDLLKRFINHPQMANIPCLIEFPSMPENEQKAIFNEIENW